ncbi:MAG: hypothetical protein AB4290_24855 [Spirulina sp.]
MKTFSLWANFSSIHDRRAPISVPILLNFLGIYRDRDRTFDLNAIAQSSEFLRDRSRSRDRRNSLPRGTRSGGGKFR